MRPVQQGSSCRDCSSHHASSFHHNASHGDLQGRRCIRGRTLDRGFRTSGVAKRLIALLVCGLLLPLAAACRPNGNSSATNQGSAKPNGEKLPAATSAEQLLERMANAYHQAARYDDRAYIELSYRDGDQIATDRGDIAVSFVRPNRLTVRAYKATVDCDGERFRAWIRDDESANLDGQTIDRPAPSRLTLRDLFGDPLLAEQMSNAVLDVGAARTPIQLDMLLADDGLQLRPAAGKTATMAGEETVDGRLCQRVELPTERGTVELWIDAESYLLRRMRFPRESLAGPLATAPELRDVGLTAHFRGATLDRIESGPLFAVESPRAKHRVRYFVSPPLPLPSQLFGQKVGEFSLPRVATTTSAAKSAAKDEPSTSSVISRDSLGGRPAVLLWFHNHPACELALKQLNSVWLKLQDEPQAEGDKPAAFFGVCTEPSAVSDHDIRELADQWKVELPLVRDLAAYGRDLFQFAGSPALLVLNAEGVVQIVEVGANPNLEKELPLILKRLAQGEDIAAEVLRGDQRERARYEQELARATGDEDPSRAAPTAGQIYPATEPRAIRRSLAWRSDQVKSPGQMIVVAGVSADVASADNATADQSPRILVIDRPREIVELDGEGKLLGRRTPAIPADAEIERINVWRDASGGEWLACQLAQPSQVVVFDPQGKLVGNLASDAQETTVWDWEWLHNRTTRGVSAQLLTAGSRGVAWFDLSKRSAVKQPVFPGACRWLVVATPNATTDAKTSDSNSSSEFRLWAGDDQGRPRAFDRVAGWSAAKEVADWRLEQVEAARFPTDGPVSFAALAANGRGRQALVAFDGDFKEQWNYPLPAGTRSGIRDRLHSIQLFRERQPFWLLAAEDGSVHMISADGGFSDFMSEGAQVAGLGAMELRGESYVVVATARGLACWRLDAPEAK